MESWTVDDVIQEVSHLCHFASQYRLQSQNKYCAVAELGYVAALALRSALKGSACSYSGRISC